MILLAGAAEKGGCNPCENIIGKGLSPSKSICSCDGEPSLISGVAKGGHGRAFAQPSQFLAQPSQTFAQPSQVA